MRLLRGTFLIGAVLALLRRRNHVRALARIFPVLFTMAFAPGASAASWNSQLFPRDPAALVHARATVTFADRSWLLPDYSYVGYRVGASSLASGVPCAVRTIKADAGGDITSALQAAIDAVGRGGGGTVLIPAGRFRITRSITVPFDNVSILGAGSRRTLIDVPSTYRATDNLYEGVFTLGKAIGQDSRRWIDRGDVLGEAESVAEGESTVTLTNAASVTVGDWIVIQQYFWPELVAANDASATWPSYRYGVFPPTGSPDRGSSFSYLRQVTAKEGNRITIDAPIPFGLDRSRNAIGIRSALRQGTTSIAPHSNLGVAGLALTFANNVNGVGGRPSGRGVYFEGVRDGWVYDVQVYNFPVSGIVIESSARVTVLRSAVYRAQDYQIGGYGYGITVDDSQNVLVRSNYVERSRHNFLNRGALDSMVVFSRNTSAAARVNGDDQHYRLAHAMLWDRHYMRYGTALTLGYRGSDSSQAQECNLSSVVWNPQDDGYRGGADGGFISVNASSSGQSMVIGGTGRYPVIDAADEPAVGEQISSIAGLQVGSVKQQAGPGSQDQNVLYESLRSPDLVPESLYEGLLTRRIGIAPPDFASTCRAAPTFAAPSPSSYTGSGTLIFNEDQLGFTPILGAGCTTQCKIDSLARNATKNGHYSALLQMSSVDGTAIGINFRGPEKPLEQYRTLTLTVFPTASDLKLVVRATHEVHQASAKGYPAYTTNALIAGQWNTLEVPMTVFGAGEFNAVRLIGIGGGATKAFYVDDVVLN